MGLEMIDRRSGAVVGAVLAATLLTSCDPAIARSRGAVTSVRHLDGQEIEVCLRDTSDAGSTYGDRSDRDSICWSGVVEGSEPTIGSCVVLQAQGESAVLGVEPADGCR